MNTPNRVTLQPLTEPEWLALRTNDITSTDCAALFGLSPYKTPFELWHEKRAGERAAFVENERMKWGKRLEHVVAQGIADDQGWVVRPMKEYVRLVDERIGSSFDFRVLAAAPGDTPDDGLLEIKCVDWLQFRDGWTIDEGFLEAPPHIELQVQHQLLVSGLRRAHIGVMIGGNDIRVIQRDADAGVHAGIRAKVAEFWRSIETGNAPDPVMPDDAEALIRMYQYAQPGKLFDARQRPDVAQLIVEYAAFKADARAADEQADVRKAQILLAIDDADKVLLDGYSVSAGMVAPTTYTVDRKGYRNFRVTPKKPAKAAPPKE
jgi:putative phage-type endonuclease